MSFEELLAERGYVVDGWERWQQGDCLTYAVALLRAYPQLQFGSFGYEDHDGAYKSFVVQHHFAHDGAHAYDSVGRHPLPYLGIDGSADFCWLQDEASDYDEVYEETLAAALDHIQRHPPAIHHTGSDT